VYVIAIILFWLVNIFLRLVSILVLITLVVIVV